MSAWRRVVGTLGVAALVAAGCSLLGLWQWHRHEARSAAVAVVEANFGASAVPLAELVPTGGPVADTQVWRPVSATGRYLTDSTVLLRNRPVDGQRGFHVLTAFEIADGPLAGRVVVVDRGWLTGGADAATIPPVPTPPDAEITLVGRLRAGEQPATGDSPARQVRSIDPEQVSAAGPGWGGSTLDAYLQAVSEDGSPPADLGALETPSTDLGPHLSYAFQWWVFAAGSLVGAVILLRRDAVTPGGGARGSGRPPARTPRRIGKSEQEEDALLDAQEAAAGHGPPAGSADRPVTGASTGPGSNAG